MLDSNVAATYNGQEYWLQALDVDVDVTYAPRSLKFIDATWLAKPEGTTVNYLQHGEIRLELRDVDSLASGEVARLRFLVTVPEFDQTDIMVEASGFLSDSLQFLDIVPSGNETPFITDGKCDITVVTFSTVGVPVMRIAPNPVSDDATISFRMQETVPVTLLLVDASGQTVMSLLDGTDRLVGGEYQVRFNTSDLPAGVYHARIQAGVFTQTRPFVVVH